MQKNILVVEDDTLLSEALSQIFKEKNYRVRVAHTGKEGLNCISAEKPDFILLDLMMPEMGGVEMLAELKKMPGYEDTPVTVLTNANDLDNVTAVMEQGGYHYFIKADTPLNAITDHVIKTLEGSQKMEVAEQIPA